MTRRKRFLADIDVLGLRAHRGHDLHRTFITLAHADGDARADLLEMITHAPRGDITNIYKLMPRAHFCAVVAKSRIEASAFDAGAHTVDDRWSV